MTTKELHEMKELYATGEWICVCKVEDKVPWMIYEDDWISRHGWGIYGEYKLIHKKHSDVLEHWLNGGMVNASKGDGFITCYGNEFIEGYNSDYKYKIIKDKPRLWFGDSYKMKYSYPPNRCKDVVYVCQGGIDYSLPKDSYEIVKKEHSSKEEADKAYVEYSKRQNEQNKSKPVERINKYVYHYISEKHGNSIDGILTLDKEILTQDRYREIKRLIWECDTHEDIKITSLSLLKTITIEANQKDK